MKEVDKIEISNKYIVSLKEIISSQFNSELFNDSLENVNVQCDSKFSLSKDEFVNSSELWSYEQDELNSAVKKIRDQIDLELREIKQKISKDHNLDIGLNYSLRDLLDVKQYHQAAKELEAREEEFNSKWEKVYFKESVNVFCYAKDEDGIYSASILASVTLIGMPDIAGAAVKKSVSFGFAWDDDDTFLEALNSVLPSAFSLFKKHY